MKKDKNKTEDSENTNQRPENLTAENSNPENNNENQAEDLKAANIILEEKNMEDKLQEEQSPIAETTSPQQDYETLVAEWKDKYIRLSAEFDNYRKRTLKEKIDLIKFAGEDIIKALLPVIDDFERGLDHIEQTNDMTAIKEGINLIYNKFRDFLLQKGLKEIEAKNCEFNTDFHEAVTKFPVQDKNMIGKIVDVIQKGYMLDEKVIRHSKVVIGE